MQIWTQTISAQNIFCGEPDIGVIDNDKHLELIKAGPHKYDQEVEARVGHAQATNKALGTIVFGNNGLPIKQRLTAWKALTFSELIFIVPHGERPRQTVGKHRHNISSGLNHHPRGAQVHNAKRW